MELAFMRSTLAYALFWLNLISTGLILTLSLLSFNTLYIILYLDIGAMFFVLLILTTFCAGENECCTSDKHVYARFPIGSCYGACICADYDCCDWCNCNGGPNDCNCNFTSCPGEAGIFLVGLLLIFCIFVGLFYLIFGVLKKHLSRIIILVLISLLYCVITGFALYSRKDINEIYFILIISFSSFATICNLLGMILPNFFCCQILSYEYVESLELDEDTEQKEDLVNDTQRESADFKPQNLPEDNCDQLIVSVCEGPNQTNDNDTPSTVNEQNQIEPTPDSDNKDITAPDDQNPSPQ